MTLKLTMKICVLLVMASPAALAETSSKASDLKDRKEKVIREIKKIRADIADNSCKDSKDESKECGILSVKLGKRQDELLEVQDKIDELKDSQGTVCLECEASRNGGMSNSQSNTTSLLASMAQMINAMRVEIAALKYQSTMSQQMNMGNMNQSMMMPANAMGNSYMPNYSNSSSQYPYGNTSSSALNYLMSSVLGGYGNNSYGNSYGSNNSYIGGFPPMQQQYRGNYYGSNYGINYGSNYNTTGTPTSSIVIPAR